MSGYASTAIYSALIAVALLVLLSSDVEAKCRKCCKKQDNFCRELGPRVNRANATTCFCDEHCNVLGDCCVNYQDICKPRDCIMDTEWSYWSECSASCGVGHKTRTKRILQEKENGGKKCGQSKQSTFCKGLKCKGRRSHTNGLQEVAETGKIIPAEFGSWRKNKLYNPYNDIRKNLFQHYNKDRLIKQPAYCAKYEVVETRKACQANIQNSWASGLEKGRTICVECQPSAMKKSLGVRCKGHGVYLKKTRWNAVTVPGCHGAWKMVSRRSECSCNPQDRNAFIFI